MPPRRRRGENDSPELYGGTVVPFVKQCAGCQRILSKDLFRRTLATKTRLVARCFACEAAYRRAWREANRPYFEAITRRGERSL
jgi:hypothetical protein